MVEYRPLQSQEDFDQVGNFQREVFGFSDLDLLPPPLLRLVARDKPSLGLHLGAFRIEEGRSRLVGAVLGFATFEAKAIYAVLIGVDPEHQGKGQGTALVREFEKQAQARGIEVLYGIFEVLDTRLARFYLGTLGFTGIELLGDRLLFRREFGADRPGRQGGDVLCRLGDGTLDELTRYLNRLHYRLVDFVTETFQGEQISRYVLRPPL